MATQNRPILYEYFHSTAQILFTEYQRSRQQEANVNIGANRERFCSRFLEPVLPKRLSLHQGGEIWDSHGNRTGQLDIILTRDDCASLTFGGTDTYLVEGVYSVIEVKSNLDRQKTREALTTLRRTKNLQINSPRASISSGPTINRPLRVLFAYETSNLNIIMEEISQDDNIGIIDIISILNTGVMLINNLLLRSDNDAPYLIIPGRAASLSFLYLYLISYSTSFFGRYLDLTHYFQPLNRWAT